MKSFFLLFLSFIIFKVSYSQDTLFLRNDSIIHGRIIFADSTMVKIRKDIRPNGPNYIFKKNEIKSISYNGQNVIYHLKYWQSSIGVSITYGHFDNLDKYYDGIIDFRNKTFGLNFIGRGKTFGFKIETGFADLYKVKMSSTNYHNPHASIFQNLYDTTHVNTFFMFYTARLNCTKGKINPYLYASFGFENQVTTNRFGFGFQFRILKYYHLEMECGMSSWNEHVINYYDDQSSNLHTVLGINISRVLREKYK